VGGWTLAKLLKLGEAQEALGYENRLLMVVLHRNGGTPDARRLRSAATLDGDHDEASSAGMVLA
jgi:hypothetical protein